MTYSMFVYLSPVTRDDFEVLKKVFMKQKMSTAIVGLSAFLLGSCYIPISIRQSHVG